MTARKTKARIYPPGYKSLTNRIFIQLGMEINDGPGPNFIHGFTLLRELNSQRGMGQFCDCVLQLHSHPGKVFLAHKSVLAAFSPVLASLLLRHGPLLNLKLPYLTLESLDLLLDYMYTGRIPTQSQEEPVLSAAVHLQMEQLLQALRCRQNLITDTGRDKPSHKRRFAEFQSLDKTPLASPSCYHYNQERPISSSPTYEVVPVICRVKKAGKSKASMKSSCCDRSSSLVGEHGANTSSVNEGKDFSHHRFPPSSNELDKGSLLEEFLKTSQSKQSSLSSSQFGSCGNSREFRPTASEDGSEALGAGVKDQCGHNTHLVGKRLSPATDCGQNLNCCPQFNRSGSREGKCIPDIGHFQPFSPFKAGKGDHLDNILSGAFHSKNLYDTSGIVQDRAHLCNRFSTQNCHQREAPLRSENSSNSVASEINRVKRTSLPETWQEISQTYDSTTLFESRTLEAVHEENQDANKKPPSTEHVDSYDFPNPATDCVNEYQGHLRYHCLLEPQHPTTDSNDSDSNQGCQVPHGESKNPGSGLVTIDITEITLLSGQMSQDPKKRSLAQPFQCSVCDRIFNHRGSLNRHMRAHLGVRPYSCSQCPMTFSRQYRVAEHMRIHQRTSDCLSEDNTATVAAVTDN